MSLLRPIGDPKLFQRPISSNPKFSDVESVVDTGPSARAVARERSTEVSVKQRPDELFRRIRPSTVANYLMATARQARLAAGQGAEDDGGLGDEWRLPPPPPPKTMLILDVRDREDFERCHIRGALNYPYVMLSRAQNQFTTEILFFKNRENHVIVLYDLDEELVVGRKVANVFFERGVDNVVIISGGLKEFVQQHSAFILGDSPVPILPQAPRRPSRQSSAAAMSECASTMATSITSHKPRGLSSSLARKSESGEKAWH